MLQTITISKSVAERTVGSLWCVDHEKRQAFQVMGMAPPPLFSGDTLTSEAAASKPWPYAYAQRPLASQIRIPKKSPFPVAGGPVLTTVSTAVYLVRLDGILTKGLRIERFPITAVEYAPPPYPLQGTVDFVASAAFFTAEARFRFRLSHSADGTPHAVDVCEIDEATGVRKPSAVMACLHEDEAVATAESLAAKLAAAADWRSNSARDDGRAGYGTSFRSPWAEADDLLSAAR